MVAGLVATLSRKGGSWHLRAGRTYVLSMGVVVPSAILLALVDGNYFLFAVAVFTGYLVLTGYRAIPRNRGTSGSVAPTDRAAHRIMLAAGVGMVGLGGFDLFRGDGLGAALVVFGVIGFVLAGREIRSGSRSPDARSEWFVRHIVFMGGAYIATVTAAVTVNLTMLPPLARWTGPTVVGTPIIVLAVLRYRREFGRTTPRGVGG